MRKCPACGERHRNQEEAAERHAPRPVHKVTVLEQPKLDFIEISFVYDDTNPILSAEKVETKEVKYRGRMYTGEVSGDGVIITLKNGKTRWVPNA